MSGTRRIGDAAAVVLWLVMAFCSPMACAASQTSPDMFSTRWSERDGAPSHIVAMAQTRDGYLWFAAPTGLYRFDALRFERVDLPGHPELSSAAVFSLLATPDGGLWIGFTLGGAAFLRDDTVRVYGAAEGLPKGSVRAWTLQQDGTVWVGATQGIARLHDGHWQSMRTATPTESVNSLFADGDDRIWMSELHSASVLRPGQSTFERVPLEASWGDFGQSSDGKVWLVDHHGLRVVGNTTGGRCPAGAAGLLLFDSRGQFWTTMWHEPVDDMGIIRQPVSVLADPAYSILQAAYLVASDGLGDGPPVGFLEDREGNVWVATSIGIVRFSRSQVRPFSRRPGWPGIKFEAGGPVVADEHDHFWMAEFSNHVYYDDGRDFHGVDEDMHVSAGLRTAAGETWFGGSQGLWRIEGSHVVEHVPRPVAGLEHDIQSLAEDADGAIWASVVREDVFKVVGGRWVAHGGATGVPPGPALIVASDRDRRIWLGYPSGLATVVEGRQATTYGKAQGLDIGPVTAVYGRRAHLWLGGQRGLSLSMNGRFMPIESELPGLFRNTAGIVETADGDVWVLGGAGLVRLSSAEVARAMADPTHRVSALIVDARQGLFGVSSALRPVPALVEGAPGHLTARTSRGLYFIDVTDVSRMAPPVTSLRSLVADDRDYAVGASVDLPPRTVAVRVRYAGLSLSAAERVHYRYRLDGFDHDWQEVQDRREAFYTNLPPGKYRFHVQAGLMGDPWNLAEASVQINLRPAFVQTRAFLALCIALALLAIFALVRWSVRRAALQAQKRENERMNVRMGERERIAREIHDTLLQSSQAVMMMIGAAASLLRKGKPATELLDRAASSGEQAIVEARERIYELRRDATRSIDVARDLKTLGERLSNAPGAARFVLMGESRCMAWALAHDVIQIGSEAMLNAFRHANASLIELRFDHSIDEFVMTIQDDGVGIGEETRILGAAPGHWGLPGMRERAKRLGATLGIDSSPTGGTVVELRMPVHVLASK